jgi:metallo-beta-lactamase family protein
MDSSLQFLGAAGTVTGSKHLVTAGGRRVLLDCGLFQGLKALRLRNWAPPPVDPQALDAVVLSHAHIDHSGYLPLLARHGYRGPVYCTPATRDLLEVMLLDAAHLQEEDAERANRYKYSKHAPALPLYETADAEAALRLLEARSYGVPFPVGESGTTALFRRAGHILGSATVELGVAGRRVVFSGDLGRSQRPILRDLERVPEADVLLVESTYGDRTHTPHPEETLATLLNETADQRRVLLVPAFAVGRTQDLIWWIRQLEEEKRIPVLPVFIDSPMAIEVTDIYARHPEEHDGAMVAANQDGYGLRTGEFRLVHRPEESRALNAKGGPMVIISASGMATGGRVLHHLAHRLPDERTTVLLPGFQAAGTRGRSLQDGARELRIHGRSVPVHAKVVALDGLSAHADRDEILAWLRGFRRPPRQTWVVHGEPQPADRLAATLRADLGWDARVAEDRATVPIG